MKKKLLFLLSMLGGGIIGGAGAAFFLKNNPGAWTKTEVLGAAAAFLLAFVGQVVVHEFGHFLFGKLAGMRFYSFRVGFLALEIENGRLRFRLYKNLGYLGLCVMLPTQEGHNRKTLMLYMVGGLVLNLVSLALCLYLILDRQVTSGFGLWFACSTVFLAFVLFLANAMPIKNSSNIATDGKYLLDGFKQSPDYYSLADILSLNALSLSGEDPAVFMPRFLQRHQQTEDPTFKVNFLAYNYLYYLSTGQPEAAFQTMQEMEPFLEQYPPTQRKEIQKEQLFAYSFLQPAPAKAKEIYQQIETRLALGKSADDYRVQAAYALYIIQEPEKARHFISEGKKVADLSMMKSFVPLEKDLLHTLEKAAQEQHLETV
ncbi:M50 family metallopeptidase [Rufibacter sp. LB8]|uniref:M50 family metallopeptidase n=1 Tax=Rufibacter sp. LB8 TaxID=2777781 RepID=UPI00178C7803|nr:M50 family metallopeptidase [Rufibacter sp. LB8]